MNRFSARLTRLEQDRGSGRCHVVEIDGALGDSAASSAVAAALAAKNIRPAGNDLVIALRRFAGVAA